MSKAHVTNIERVKMCCKRILSSGRGMVMSVFEASNSYLSECCFSTAYVNSSPWGTPLSFSKPVGNGFAIEDNSIQKDLSEKALLPISMVKSINTDYCMDSDKEKSQETNEKNLKTLLDFLSEAGQNVSELKALPSGTVRITVDDLLMSQKSKEAEFARVEVEI